MTLALMPVMAMSETWAMAWPSHTGGLPHFPRLEGFVPGEQKLVCGDSIGGNGCVMAGDDCVEDRVRCLLTICSSEKKSYKLS